MGVMIISYAQYFFIININISFIIFITSSILLVCPKNIFLYIFYIFLELLAQVFHHLNQIPKSASFKRMGEFSPKGNFHKREFSPKKYNNIIIKELFIYNIK